MRVVLWDNHPVVRLALTSLLGEMEDGWEAVHLPSQNTDGGSSHVEKLRELGPFDLLIWDPRPSPFAYLDQEQIAQVKRDIGHVPLMVFTDLNNHQIFGLP